jgi:hypothetical protein
MFNQHHTNDMATERTYIGKGWQREGSYYIDLVLDLNALDTAPVEARDGRRTVRVRLAKLRNPGKGGTHTLYLREQEDREAMERGRVADQQEMESRS